jgi:hypothetical protein
MIFTGVPESVAARWGHKSKPCQLYRHFDKIGRLLYVGISLSAIARLSRHSHDAHWFHEIVTVTIQTYPGRPEAMIAEARAIEDEKPLHNLKRHHPQVMAWDEAQNVAP